MITASSLPVRSRLSAQPSRRLAQAGTAAAVVAATLIATATPALAAITFSQPTTPVLSPGATGEVTFTLAADPADPVGRITFTAPDNTTFTRASYTWNGGPGAIGCGVSVDAKTLTCPPAGLDTRGLYWFGAATIGVELMMDPDAPADTTMTSGTVTNFDHAGVQNGQGPYTAKTPPPPPADLAVSVTDSADPVALGGSYTYTTTVTNNGPGAATGVTAATTLSGAAGSIVSAVASQGSCAVAAPAVTCALGAVADAASATVTITVEPTATGTTTATATASATETDPNATDNTAAQSTTITNALGCTITGTAGNDTLIGGNGNDVICGLGGNDTINGGNGNDTIYAGTGNDTVDGGNSDDILYGGPGDDGMGGGNGADRLYGEAGNDTNYGETLLGSLLYLFDNGNDHIYGGPGNDDLDGQNGNDTVSDTDGADTDTMSGNLGNDTINVQDGAGDDTANGGLGTDTCTVDTGDTTTGC